MPLEEILQLETSASPTELGHIRQEVAAACLKLGFAQRDIDAIVLAIDEACTNIIRYAYKDCNKGNVTLEILSDGKQAIFRLHDEAPKSPRDCLKLKKIDLTKPGGLGVMLMRQVMDWVGFVDTKASCGNILELKKKLPLETQ